MYSRTLIALLAATGLTAPLAAESTAIALPAQSQASEIRNEASPTGTLAQFAPQAERREHRIDYAHWDEALGWMVVPMGPSIRQGAARVTPRTGTRRIYGHESRYRLEGNRVAFSYLTPEIRVALTQYREDLERIGTELDITALPRNEQLAYWLNLHNVAVIEALAGAYPLTEVVDETDIHDRKLVTVNGVALSPRDIREGIVYSNWRDPKVIYGFWHGVIGGPSIQRLAYTGANVDALLSLSAEEFVNSLRGVEQYSGALQVSPIYREAAGFFPDEAALIAHFAQYAREDTRELIANPRRIAYKRLETDIADLQRGERDPSLATLCIVASDGFGLTPTTSNCTPARTVPNPAIQRLLEERATKLDRARRAGIRTGMVIYGDGEYVEGETPEVE